MLRKRLTSEAFLFSFYILKRWSNLGIISELLSDVHLERADLSSYDVIDFAR